MINVPSINQCQSCAFAKTHRMISRFFDNAKISSNLFFRITFDLIQLAPVYNKDEWIFHLICHVIDFNMIFIHSKKSETTKILRKAIKLIETRFNRKIIFIRIDEEKSLNNDFDELFIEKNIIYEFFTPDTSAQNGHFERKGGILVMKTKIIRIDVDLSNHLWPEIIQATNYLINRIFMKKHDWKIFYELIVNYFSNLEHLHSYDCKAYSLNKHIFKKHKLQQRVHVKHLIDYETRNIFRIWISSQRKIIKIKNVMFDDQISYNADDIDLMQMIHEFMLKTIYEGPNMKIIS